MAESVAPPRPTLQEIQDQLGRLINESADSERATVLSAQPEAPAVNGDDAQELSPSDQPEAPQSPELVQQKIDSIHLNEVHSVSQAVLMKKAETITDPTNADLSPQLKQRLSKYKNIRNLKLIPDGPTKFEQDKGKILDEFPLTLGDNEAPYVRPVTINGVTTYAPASFLDTEAVQIASVIRKDGNSLQCKDRNGNIIDGVPIDSLADAQMHFVLEADDLNSSFTPHEIEVLKAYDDLAQNGNENAVKELYNRDAVAIKEASRNHTFVSADSAKIYLDKIYAEIKPEPGEQLTADQLSHNEKLRMKKEAIIQGLNLDARVIADTEVMVGIVTQTIGATLDNLRDAIQNETDPAVRKLYEETLTTLSQKENQDKLPDVMKTAMEDMSPEFAMAMNKSLETGDVKGLYTELIKKFPAAEKLKEFDSKMADKILVGGLGIMAIFAALLGTVAAAGMKPAR